MKTSAAVDLENYKSLVFDCDGVILNSNKTKTQAFYNAALPYGQEAAQALVNYHVANGGISRYKKFERFLNQMIPVGAKGPTLDELLSTYAGEVRQGLTTCEIAEGLSVLRERTTHANWFIVSGGDQTELRNVFSQRDLSNLFDGGIFGSPDTKDQILTRELNFKSIRKPALFFGDSVYDYQAASKAGLDFIFISHWSDVKGWEKFCDENRLSTARDLWLNEK